MNRRWIPVVFWIVFLAVLGLSSQFPRLQAIWPAMLLLAVGALAVKYLVQVIRGRPVPQCGASRGWMQFLLKQESKPTPPSPQR